MSDSVFCSDLFFFTINLPLLKVTKKKLHPVFVDRFQQIEKYRALASEIMGLPSIEHYDMIRLDCEDLKVGLAAAARGLADELLSRVSADHRKENET